MSRLSAILAATGIFSFSFQLKADEEVRPKGEKESGMTVADIAEQAKPSLVVVAHEGRGASWTGSGFVVSEDGLIATNLHVIGQARPIRVRFSDGEEFEVTEVHASDRKLDLAVIRIDPKKRKLNPLPLGNSESLKQGQRIVAMGNPQGLEFSVVDGVVSAVRDFGDGPMLQLAIPVERGNSGGPVFDLQGRVHGVMTLKSAITENLGFAMPINALKKLIDKPNPVKMDRWMTIGKLDPDEWKTPMGARWSQRAGEISVSGTGEGFGGRALCISTTKPPGEDYEVAVEVRLDNEAGAAGLAFESDGGDLHYGFYPTGGSLRMTRFDGPNVFSWNIFETVESPSYRKGSWNRIRVRVEGDTITGYVNGQEVIKVKDGKLRGGLVGVCKFRETEAEFKNFRVGKDLSARPIPEKFAKELADPLAEFLDAPNSVRETVPLKLVELMASDADSGRRFLEEEANQIERRASRLRALADRVHAEAVRQEFAKALSGEDEDIDLLRSALIIAKLDNPDVDIQAYLDEVDRIAKAAAKGLKKDASPAQKLERLREYLFEEAGFHGSRGDYYNKSNSYLNEVIDDREGIPITLSVLHLELADRLGIEGLAGIALPGHFVVGHLAAVEEKKEELSLIDVFEGAKAITRKEAEEIVRLHTGGPLRDEFLLPVGKREILARMMRNLVGIAIDENPESALPYIELLLVAAPEDHSGRLNRGLLLIRAGDIERGRKDLEWLISTDAPGIDTTRLQDLLNRLP